MKIKDIPWYNQPGFKLTKKGVTALDEPELLSIIFWANDEKDDTLGISNKILKKYNLHKIEGVGYNNLVNLVKKNKRKKAKYTDFIKVMKLLSLIELSKRYNRLANKGYKKFITCAKDVYDIFSDRMKNYKKEHLFVLLLDTKNKIISGDEQPVSVGTLNSSLIHPREVFKEAIKEGANSIILVHNHPSGDWRPSKGDSNVTERIKDAGKILKINLVDHVIIGKDKYYSFKEKVKK